MNVCHFGAGQDVYLDNVKIINLPEILMSSLRLILAQYGSTRLHSLTLGSHGSTDRVSELLDSDEYFIGNPLKAGIRNKRPYRNEHSSMDSMSPKGVH